MKTTKKIKFHPEYGRIEQVKYYLLGFHFWTENNPIPKEDEPIKPNRELEEITGFNEWTKDYNLTNEDFDKFQNQQNNRL